MTEVKVLIEGYAKETEDGWVASSTTTLVEESGKKILVDPGKNRKLLLARLSKVKLKPEEIDFVFMTHYHVDHNLLMGIFPKAKVLDDETIYDEDREIAHQGVIPGTKIKIIKTPGHERFHGSLVVSTSEGVVVVAGDVFWWADQEEQKTDRKNLLSHKDPFVKDEKALLESRKKVLEVADWVIPGHGKMFKNDKNK
jgi:glyoxylase-like metal-dependent hydrolase (beta-lactamase superfamily II)